MWKPVVVVAPESFGAAASAVMEALSPPFQDYGLGWFIENYHGHTIIEHTGAVLGAVAALYLIPEKNVGIATMINSEDGAARRAVAFHLMDYYLGVPDQNWNVKLKQLVDSMVAEGGKALKAQPQQAHVGGKPSQPRTAYAGVYRDPWYGTATVSKRGADQLWIKFDQTPGMEAPLEPAGGDTFKAAWTDKTIEAAYVKFDLAGKKVSKLEMWPFSPLADFSFDYLDLHFVRAH
jgi:hypothetical protein